MITSPVRMLIALFDLIVKGRSWHLWSANMWRCSSTVYAVIYSVLLIADVAGFQMTSFAARAHCSSQLFESSRETGGNNMDALRKHLEESWDSVSMGHVPTNSNAAAVEASSSLFQALAVKMKTNPYTPNIFSIQLLLPSLDITSGTNMYDDVALVDFCVELAKAIEANKCLEPWYDQGQNEHYAKKHDVCIMVRDEIMAKNSQRVLAARGKLGAEAKPIDTGTQFYDDFAETDSSNIFQASSDNLVHPLSSYRLTSLFQNYTISTGPDMTNDVVRAISSHHILEHVILVVSPITPAEMLAVRKLVQDYAKDKIILLVNEKLDPWPRELQSCEIIYSILPLIAAPSDNRSFMKQSNEDNNRSRPMNIVLMKKAPKDWELYIDIMGEGFQLIGCIADTRGISKKGPSMDWIATKVKEFLNRR